MTEKEKSKRVIPVVDVTAVEMRVVAWVVADDVAGDVSTASGVVKGASAGFFSLHTTFDAT